MGCTNVSSFNYDPTATTDDGSCIAPHVGCTTVGMLNYDATAIPNSAPCIPIEAGCTDSTAVNYFSLANQDDGTCTPAVYGCTIKNATNYDSSATINVDDQCVYPTPGCTDSRATDNYFAAATIDDGSCTLSGCTNPLARNYWSEANADDGTCDTRPPGCTDPAASNYAAGVYPDQSTCLYLGCTTASGTLNFDSIATSDDGSCRYDPAVYGCMDSTADNYMPAATSNTGCAYGGCMTVGAPTYNPSATYDDGSCGVVSYGCTDSNALNYAAVAQADDGTCAYAAVVVYGCVESAATNYNPSATPSAYASPCTYGGCTDSELPEYNPSATFNDGSCPVRKPGCADSRADNYNAVFNIHRPSSCTFSGCTNSIATNYDPTATLDDASCIIPPAGCTSPAADNFNPTAQRDDGSCVTIGCRDPRATNYNPAANQDGIICTWPSPSPPPSPPPPSPPSTPPAFPPRSTSSGAVASVALIGEGRGWPQTLAPNEGLGTAVAGLGDLDGDGIADVAVGAKGSAAAAGRFYITLLNNGGGARSVSLTEPAGLSDGDHFGSAIASSADIDGDAVPDNGDIDGDSITDVAVGAYGDDGDAGADTGAVYLMFLNTDGSSRADYIKVCNRSSATDSKVVSVTLDAGAQFGHSVAMLGVDPANKAAVVLAVGAPMQEGGRGAVHMLSLQLASRGSAGRRLQTTPAATVAMRWLLNLPTAPAGERLGTSVAFIPDRNRDEFPDLAIGAPSDGTGTAGGKVYIMGSKSGRVMQIIEASEQFRSAGARFGFALALGGDYDGNGLPELLVGAPGEANGGGAHLVYMPDIKTVHYAPADLGFSSSSGRRLQSDLVVPIGDSVAVAGRIDIDLVPDLVLGSPQFGASSTGGLINIILEAAIAPPSPPGFSADDSMDQTVGGFDPPPPPEPPSLPGLRGAIQDLDLPPILGAVFGGLGFCIFLCIIAYCMLKDKKKAYSGAVRKTITRLTTKKPTPFTKMDSEQSEQSEVPRDPYQPPDVVEEGQQSDGEEEDTGTAEDEGGGAVPQPSEQQQRTTLRRI